MLADQLTDIQFVPTTEAPPENLNGCTSAVFLFCHDPLPDVRASIRSVTTLT